MAQRTVLTGLLLLALLALAASASPVLPVGEPVAVSAEAVAFTPACAHADSPAAFCPTQGATLSLGDFAVDFAVTVSPVSIEPTAPLSPPALPSALVLVLVGFILLTVVRDRQAWFGAGLGLFRLTQAGLVSLPRIAASFAAGRICDAAVSGRLVVRQREISRSAFTPEISYIGLLHRLGSAGGDGVVAAGLRRNTWTFQNAARPCLARVAAFSFAFATSTAGFARGSAHLMEIGNTRKLEILYPRERR